MKFVKKHSLIVGLVLLVALIFVTMLYKARSTNDLPGSVIGPNPLKMPESELPVCDFNGVKFKIEPCYSPPGTLYY